MKKKYYVKPTNDTCFPATNSDIRELEYKLRYNGFLLHDERLVLASVVNAYIELVNNKTQKNRNMYCSAIKKLSMGK